MVLTSGENTEPRESVQDGGRDVPGVESARHCNLLSQDEVQHGPVSGEDRHLLPATEQGPGARHGEGEVEGGGGEGVQVTLVPAAQPGLCPRLTQQSGRLAGLTVTVSVPGQTCQLTAHHSLY